MTILAILATAFGTISGFANIPQIIKIFKRKKAGDISILTYLILFGGAISWLLYGFELKNIPVILTNTIGAITIGLVLIGCLIYGEKKK